MSILEPFETHPPTPGKGVTEASTATPTFDETSMLVALSQAQEAARKGEVPVGAAVYHRGVLIAQAHNAPIGLCDPTAHAEVLALKAAAQVLGNYRLQECTLYVTLEPCAMCAGAVFNARLFEVVYAAKDLKAGAAGSVLDLFADARINHHTQIRGGVLKEQSVHLLQEFFKSQRLTNRQEALSSQSFLREDAIRKPIGHLSGYGSEHAESHFYTLKSVSGMRLHYRQAHRRDAPFAQTYLCLHGANTSSSFFEPLLDTLLAPNSESTTRILVPDGLGHGASDRFKKSQPYTFKLAMNALLEWMEALDLQGVTVITHDASLVWGLCLKALSPQRVVSLVGLNACWRSESPSSPVLGGQRQDEIQGEVGSSLYSSSSSPSSSFSSSHLGHLAQASPTSPTEPSPLPLYELMDLWLQRALRVADLKSHFSGLSPDLSVDELQDLCSGFERPFERTVFEAFHRLYPPLEVALAELGLGAEDLQRHGDRDFLEKSTLMFTQPFSSARQPLPDDLLGAVLSRFAVREGLNDLEFLSPLGIARLGQTL